MSTTAVSYNSSGEVISGTSGTTISNGSTNGLSSNEFLDLMMDELTHQDPTSADSSDPTAYLTQLAQMTSVEQEEKTAAATNLQSAMSMIGDTVTYTDSTSGYSVTGTVSGIQVSNSTPTLTIGSTTGIALSSVTAVRPATSQATSSSSTTKS